MATTRNSENQQEVFTSGNPKLGLRHRKDGKCNFFLDYYMGRESVPILNEDGTPALYEDGKMKGTPKRKVIHKRKRVFIPDLFLYEQANTQKKKLHNSAITAEVEKIRILAEDSFNENGAIYGELKVEDNEERFNLIGFFNDYYKRYKKKDLRMIRSAINEFKSFLASAPEYTKFVDELKPQDFKKAMVNGYANYLLERHEGEGACSVFSRFKKMVKYAYDNELIDKNPCAGVVVAKKEVEAKDVLTKDEIKKLIDTKDERQSKDIRNAFIFCLFTGMRFCDVKDLKYRNIDFSGRTLTFEQSKTKGHSSASRVVLKLNDLHMGLIGDGEKDDLVFKLPSHTMCLKSLRRWVAKAGIDKHITWHCARHSYGTMLVTAGVNTRVAASMMGHSSMQYIMRYTQHIDNAKNEAMDKLTSGF